MEMCRFIVGSNFLQGEAESPEDGRRVYIEPGMPFGFGSHKTSPLCARVLVMSQRLDKKTNNLII
jgi:ribosomal protein L11 methylase PrmA